MRNLKKILALVLALMMALSVMVFASAANYDDYSDKDQISEEYAEAVEVTPYPLKFAHHHLQ